MENNKLKKVVLINQHTTYIFIDIINSFCKEYDEVVLLAGVVRPMAIPLDPKVKVVSIPMYNKKNIVTRIISWSLGFVKSVFLLNFYYRKHDVFVSTNPPLNNFITLFCKNKVSLLVYDVYPDGLTAAGFITKNNFIYKIWASLNRKAFKKFKSIVAITNGMAKLLSTYVESSKILVVPAWANQSLSNVNESNETNDFISKFNVKDKFLIIYSGNLGIKHDLESLVELAKNLTDYKDIEVLIIGEGFKKSIIEDLINKYNITNCQLLPYLPANMFLSMLKAMQVGVVSLEKETSQISIPSKTFNILGVGKPIICLGTKESDLAELLETNQAGMSFTSDSIEMLTSFVIKLYSDKNYYAQLTENASKLSLKFSYKNADIILKDHLEKSI
jgi:glycosyltransferase involved in cell wall biosynthesis